MKISKLFHWLYAVLMLLPVAFIGVRCGYVMFNKNAKDSYSQSVSYKYKSNVVNDVTTDLIRGNIYKLTLNTIPTTNGNYPYAFTAIYDLNSYTNFSIDVSSNESYFILPEFRTNNITFRTENYTSLVSKTFSDTEPFQPISFYVVFYRVQNSAQIANVDLTFEYTDFNILTANNTDAFLDNAFEYSVNQLNEVPLFSWAKDSFLVTPFSYITGLFGLASTSPINTLLSYWLSISIIWLVFDLVMYLPLLVHRWLDKGVLE